MTLRTLLSEHIRACFTGLWLESHEHPDALQDIAAMCRDEQWNLMSWDIETGLSIAGQPSDDGEPLPDPVAAVRALAAAGSDQQTTLLVLPNFHRFLQSAEVVQAVAQQVIAGKQNRTFLIVLAPVVQLPVELKKLFVVLQHERPDRQQLHSIAEGIATEDGELPTGNPLQTLLDAASGLTRLEAENAFSLSLVRHGKLQADVVWDLKMQTINRTGLLTLHRTADDFSTLGGLQALKEFCRRALTTDHTDAERDVDVDRDAERVADADAAAAAANTKDAAACRARGVLLLSPPGCGKSAFCKALGQEVDRPFLCLNVGSLMGSLVGQSEERTRQALQIVDAMAPCVLMIDEVEKAFAGINGSGDSGVASRMFGTFLSWLNDHSSDVFVVCTANDVQKLPPEFSRSERFDAVFFLDLPDTSEKRAIWDIWQTVYGIEPLASRPDDTGWTGAEIRACCRLARLLNVSLQEAADNVVPVSVTAAESMERLRSWAAGRCLSASEPGRYRLKRPVKASRRRRAVSADATQN